MGISLNDLSPKAREQVIAKVAIEEARRRNKDAEIPKLDKQTSKYRAKKVQACLADGTPHTFDSVKEFDRYQQLVILERAGAISDLQVQVPFELIPKQRKANGKTDRSCSYIADFVYKKNGETIVEDTKGVRTKEYIVKRKLMLWVHHITITEV